MHKHVQYDAKVSSNTIMHFSLGVQYHGMPFSPWIITIASTPKSSSLLPRFHRSVMVYANACDGFAPRDEKNNFWSICSRPSGSRGMLRVRYAPIE